MSRFKFNLEEFSKRAKKVHGDAYQYLDFKRVPGKKIKVLCWCNKVDKYGITHGEFWKSTDHLLNGQGCPSCSNKNKSLSTEKFIQQSIAAHTSEYDNLSYEKTAFNGYGNKVIVTCHNVDDNGKEHGDFEISPGHLLSGQGCPICRYIKSGNRNKNMACDEIHKLMEIHPQYDYSLAFDQYKDTRTRIPVICHEKDENGAEHGIFMMSPANTKNKHLYSGCPKCGRKSSTENRKETEREFFSACTAVHNGFYDYSKTNYTGSKNYIYPICPKHGQFKQKAANHKFGQGCPLCFKEKSNIEREITEFIETVLGDTIVTKNDRHILDGNEIDIFIPDLKIGFEVDGLIWHSEKFEEDPKRIVKKTELAMSKGVRLYHIFEDEWLYKKEITKSIIKHILGKTENKIYARQCEIRNVNYNEAKKFIDENHIQGNVPSSIRYGLYHNNELVSIMTFGKKRINVGRKSTNNCFELIRFCNKKDTSVVGGASKLFKHFIKNNKFDTITSYCDRRLGFGDVYKILGFIEYRKSNPSYYYTRGRKRINRFSLRKDVLVSKYGCPKDKTEHEWCLENGYYRIYDCGCLCYIWEKNGVK